MSQFPVADSRSAQSFRRVLTVSSSQTFLAIQDKQNWIFRAQIQLEILSRVVAVLPAAPLFAVFSEVPVPSKKVRIRISYSTKKLENISHS